MKRSLSRLSAWWPSVLSVVMLSVIIATYRDYGPNWDDAVQARYGELVIEYFTSGFTDTRSNRFLDSRFYSPLVEVIPAIFYGQSGEHKYEIRHLFVALIGLTTIPALIRYCRLSQTSWLAGLAVLAFVTMPRFYGDWFTNSKDIPFASLMAWSMYAVAAMFMRRQFTWTEALNCSLAFGLTLCARPGGFPLLATYFVGAGLLSYLCAGAERQRAFNRRAALRLGMQGLSIFAIAWILMILPWPWAHQNPIANPIEAMLTLSFTTSHPVLFEGRMVLSNAVPRYYLVKFLLITTPPAVLLFAFVGMVTGLLEVRRAPAQSFVFLTTLMWLVIPPALFVVFRPNVYDGVRHFLFVLPAVAVLAAYGVVWLCSQLHGSRSRAATLTVCAALFLLPVRDLIVLHPYQTTYFNFLVGGVAGADGKYDTDYWLISYREAIAWVNQQAAHHPGKQITVEVAGDDYITPWVKHYAAQNVRPRIVSEPPAAPILPDGIDYFIATTRYAFHRGYAKAPIVHVIGRRGAVFTVIKARGERS